MTAPVTVAEATAAPAGTSTTTRRKTTSAQRRAQRKADAVKFALSPEQRASRERRSATERLRRDSRWFSNTKFGRLFSKPPFGMYGNGNRHPTDGGVFDGGYMSSHNIMPLMHPANPKTEVSPVETIYAALGRARLMKLAVEAVRRILCAGALFASAPHSRSLKTRNLFP